MIIYHIYNLLQWDICWRILESKRLKASKITPSKILKRHMGQKKFSFRELKFQLEKTKTWLPICRTKIWKTLKITLFYSSCLYFLSYGKSLHEFQTKNKTKTSSMNLYIKSHWSLKLEKKVYVCQCTVQETTLQLHCICINITHNNMDHNSSFPFNECWNDVKISKRVLNNSFLALVIFSFCNFSTRLISISIKSKPFSLIFFIILTYKSPEFFCLSFVVLSSSFLAFSMTSSTFSGFPLTALTSSSASLSNFSTHPGSPICIPRY